MSVVEAIIQKEQSQVTAAPLSVPLSVPLSSLLVHMSRRPRALLLRDLHGRTPECVARLAGHTETALLIAAAAGALYEAARVLSDSDNVAEDDVADDVADREQYLLATAYYPQSSGLS